MPNIRKTFPGSSRITVKHEEEDDDDDDDDDDNDEEVEPAVSYQPVYRGGGKQFGGSGGAGGKGFRPPPVNDNEEDSGESDSSDDEEQQVEKPIPPQHRTQPVSRGSGKQLGGGKYLRPSNDDDDDVDSDEEDEEENVKEADPAPQQIVRVMPRGGGKNFIRPQVPDESDEDDDDSEDESEDEGGKSAAIQARTGPVLPPAPTINSEIAHATKPYQPAIGREGGKSLSQMQKPVQPPASEESEESEEDDDEESDNDAKKKIDNVRPNVSGGKQLRRPEVASTNNGDPSNANSVPTPTTGVSTSIMTGGKQLRTTVKQHPPSGKRLPVADHEDDDEEEDDDDEEIEVSAVKPQARPTGGKILRASDKSTRPSGSDEEDDDDDDEDIEVLPKQVDRVKLQPNDDVGNDDADIVKKGTEVKQQVTVAPRGGFGKQLRSSEKEKEDDDEEDEDEDLDDEDDPGALTPATAHGGGKQLRPPTKPLAIQPVMGGKQLVGLKGKLGANEDDDEEDEEMDDDEEFEDESTTKKVATSIQPSGSGKQLRMPEPVKQPPGSGKTLRVPDEDVDEDDEMDETTKEKVVETEAPAKAKAGGKQLRKPEPNATPKAKGNPKKGKKEDDEMDDGEFDDMDDSPSESEDSDDDDFGVSRKKKRKGPAKAKAKPKPSAKPTRKPQSDSKKTTKKVVEDDFGDDDRSSGDEVEFDLNNADGLIKDEADRKYLDSLPEIDREAILAERFEKVKAEQDMKKAIREAKRKEDEAQGKTKEDKKVKEKSYADGDEELAKSLAGRRSSVRERDLTGAKSKKAAALAALKKERKIQLDDESSDGSEINFGGDDEDSDEDYDDPAAKPWQKKTTDTSKSTRTDQKEDSGEDMDIDDDDDDGDKKTKDSSKKVKHMDDAESSAFDAKLEDFAKVTVPRRRLERWCNEPFFKAAVLECFVRILIGEDENGEKVYRLCEIVDIKATSKSYKFPVVDKAKKPVSTSNWLRLKFGTSERDFPMYLVSDAPPTEADVQKYITAQKNSRLEVLSRRRATKLRRVQDELIGNYTYTTEDIEKNLQQKKKSGKANTNLGSETTRNAIAVKAAREAVAEAVQKLADAKKALLESSGNPVEESKLEDRVHDCTDAVKDAKKMLEDRIEVERVTLGAAKDRKQKLANRSKDANWAKVNERALQMNQQADREGYKALKDAEPAKPPGKQEELNLYARRRVKPKVLWKTASALREEDEEDDTKREEKKDDVVTKTKQQLQQQQQKQMTDFSSPPSLIQESHKAAALSDSHQFAIDEEGLVQSSVLGTFGLDGTAGSAKGVNRRKRPRKGLSLSQYLDLKAKEVVL